MTLEITRKGSNYPEQVIQNSDFAKNFDCYKNAVSQSAGSYANWCNKYENLIYFKLTDYTAQDINVLATQALEIENIDKVTKNSTMKVSRKLSTVRYQRVGREDVPNYPAVDFESLWQVSFALENVATHARQLWMVQNDKEERNYGRSRRL